jgi:hypothetical protein
MYRTLAGLTFACAVLLAGATGMQASQPGTAGFDGDVATAREIIAHWSVPQVQATRIAADDEVSHTGGCSVHSGWKCPDGSHCEKIDTWNGQCCPDGYVYSRVGFCKRAPNS